MKPSNVLINPDGKRDRPGINGVLWAVNFQGEMPNTGDFHANTPNKLNPVPGFNLEPLDL